MFQLGEFFGAWLDLFRQERSERAHRLEMRLEQLARWAVYLLLGLAAWYGYQYWHGVLLPELNWAREGGETGTVSAGQSRESLFLIFAAALAGPVVLLVAWMVVGFGYRLLRDSIVRLFPPLRHLLVPLLLLAGLHTGGLYQEELTDLLVDGYLAVDGRVGQARAVSVQVTPPTTAPNAWY